MSYIGNGPPLLAQYGVESFNGGGTSFTLSKPATTATVLVFIDGVRQTPTDAYSVSGVTLTTTATTPSGTDNVTVQFLGDVVDFGEPSDDSVSTAKIQDDAVTADKLANSINTEIAANTAKTGITSGQASAITANTAKVTNATHTGDVTGATALTIAVDAVDIAMLSATGTADATTFLRGDNAWAAAGGDNTPAWHVYTSTAQSSLSENTWIKVEFDTEIIDTDSAYDNSTNYRFTVPSGKGGTYFVYARVYVQSSSAYLRQWGAKVYKNGAEVTGQIGSMAVGEPYPTRQVADAYGIVDLSVADYLEVYGWVDTNSGGTGLFQASNTSFGGYKLL